MDSICVLDDFYKANGVKEHGFYNCYDYAICMVNHHPCCYVFLKDGDPYCDVTDYDEVNASMHGGCTFVGNPDDFIERYGIKLTLPAKNVIGWDYAHYNDYIPSFANMKSGKIWTLKELKDEVHKVIDYLMDLKDWRGNYE